MNWSRSASANSPAAPSLHAAAGAGPQTCTDMRTCVHMVLFHLSLSFFLSPGVLPLAVPTARRVLHEFDAHDLCEVARKVCPYVTTCTLRCACVGPHCHGAPLETRLEEVASAMHEL